MFRSDNPLIVQGDKTILLEVANRSYAPARDALARFAELLDKTSLTEDMVGEDTGLQKQIRPVTISTYQIITYRKRGTAKGSAEEYPHFELFNARNWGPVIYDEVHLLPAPDMDHQDFSAVLFNRMFNLVEEKNPGTIRCAPLDVILDDGNVVQPDIVFVAASHRGIIKDAGIFGSPDIAVEILSPSSVASDRYRKRRLYEKFRVPEYWIADRGNVSIEVLRLTAEYALWSDSTFLYRDHFKCILDHMR